MASFSKSIAAGLLVLGGGALSSSCVDNNSSLFVYGVLEINSSQCLASPDSPVFLPAGTLDRLFADGYQAALLVGSHLTQRGSREKLRTETSRIQITGAHMTLYGTNNNVIEFDTPATGLVDPASGTDPGQAAIFARLIPRDDQGVDKLGPDGQMIARIRVLGTTLGGEDIESGNFDFPITLCTGCLVQYPPSLIIPNSDPPACYGSTDKAPDTTVCFHGQDVSFPCTDCAAYDPVCEYPSKNPINQPDAGTP